MPSVIRYSCFIIGVLLAGLSLKAQQTPYLERVVTMHVNNRSLPEVFKTISEQAVVVFSYSQTFNDKQKVTFNCYKKPLRLVLNELLKETGCTYKAKDKFIILKCDNKPVPPPSVISGYVYNAEDSSVISNASIYVKQTRHSAQSNDYGFFSLSFSNKLPNISVSFAKENYKDSTLVIYNQSKQEVVLYLYPRNVKKDTVIVVETPSAPIKDSIIVIKKDTVIPPKSFFSRFWQPLKTFNTNLKNISDTLFSDASVSLVPYVSTNRLLSINTVNKFSLNILAGYSKGISVFELGGLLNIDNGNVRYGQIAGLGNIVSGTSSGAQVAGLFNYNHLNTTGAQVAGVLNLDKAKLKGVQVAGIANSVADSVNGVQLAGVFNRSKGPVTGAQIAGVYNKAPSIDGMQLSSICNVTDTVKGLQLTGLVNSSKQNNGVQFAGFLNYTKHLKGVQLSLINIADTSSGVSIGLFNYVKKGYHKLEIGTDELLFGTLSFGTGTERLYTIFLGGINYSKPSLITYGFGLGTGFTLKRKLGLCFNVTAQQIQSTARGTFEANTLGKAFIGLEYKFRPKFRITLGPTFNIFSTNLTDNPNSLVYSELPANRVYEQAPADSGLKLWLGGKIALKFF